MRDVIRNHAPKDLERRSIFLSAPRVVRPNQAGSALVELALMFPIFLLMLVGSAEFGRLAYAAIEVSNAARAGAAYGAQSHITASNYTGMELAATQDAPNVAGITATATNFCSCSSAPSTPVSCTTVLSSCSTAPLHSLEYVQVNTTATIGPLFNYPGIAHTFTLTGRAIMRVEQ
jgi:Flp pilus assembly protein TadG